MYSLSDADLNVFKDKRYGELGFILFNGEHLKDVNLDRIQGYPTFVLDNGLTLSDVFYVTLNTGIIELVYNNELWNIKIDNDYPMFSEDITKGVYTAYSSGYIATQIAYYMGIEPVVLLGLDTVTKTEEVAFEIARKAFNDNGRNIFNGSSWTGLSYKIIPRISLDIFNI